MKRYHNIYFELFGKKMKVKVLLDHPDEAQQYIERAIKVHKIEIAKDDFNDIANAMDFLENIVGKKK